MQWKNLLSFTKYTVMHMLHVVACRLLLLCMHCWVIAEYEFQLFSLWIGRRKRRNEAEAIQWLRACPELRKSVRSLSSTRQRWWRRWWWLWRPTCYHIYRSIRRIIMIAEREIEEIKAVERRWSCLTTAAWRKRRCCCRCRWPLGEKVVWYDSIKHSTCIRLIWLQISSGNKTNMSNRKVYFPFLPRELSDALHCGRNWWILAPRNYWNEHDFPCLNISLLSLSFAEENSVVTETCFIRHFCFVFNF